MQSEHDTVRQAQKYDEEAVAKLYEEHFDKIYRYIFLKVGNHMEAEDITQQVFFNALRSISTFEWRGTPISAWLYRIAHNQIVDYLRKKNTHQTTSLNDPSIVSSGSSNPLDVVERRFDIEELHLAMEQLTESQREVISLRFAGDLPIAEVAKLMGRSEGAVKALQHNAVKSLRKAMFRGAE